MKKGDCIVTCNVHDRRKDSQAVQQDRKQVKKRKQKQQIRHRIKKRMGTKYTTSVLSS